MPYFFCGFGYVGFIRYDDIIVYLWYDYFGELKYEEGIVTPLLHYEAMPYIDAQEYVEQFGKDVLDYGCIFNVYLFNKKKSPVTISETSIVIDDIKKIQKATLRIIANYSTIDNQLTIYAINNGTKEFSGSKLFFQGRFGRL